MSGMNIYLQKIAELNSSPQINLRSLAQPRSNVSTDSFTFDSLMNNMNAKDGSRRADLLFGEGDGRREIRREQDYNDRHKKVEQREYKHTSRDLYDRPDYNDNKVAASEDRGRADKTESKTAAPENGMDNEIKQVLNEEDTIKTEESSGQDNKSSGGLTDALLIDLVNSKTAGLIEETPAKNNTGLNSVTHEADAGAPGNQNTSQEGALLNALTGSPAEDTNKNVGLQKHNSAGLQMPAPVREGRLTAGEEQNKPAAMENKESMKGALMDMESAVKTGESSSQPKGESSGGKEALAQTGVMKNEVKAADIDSDNFQKDLSSMTRKDNDARDEQGREMKFRDQAAASNLTDPNKGSKDMANRVVLQFAENLNRVQNVKNAVHNQARPVYANPEANNTAAVGDSYNTHEGGKTLQGPQAAHGARPSAFTELVDKIVYIAKGSNKLGVHVESETLGKLKISLSLEKGMVNVQINTPDRAVREFIENNMQQIVESLSRGGVSIGGFSVGLKNHNNDNNFSFNQGNRGKNDFSVKKGGEQDYINMSRYVPAGSAMVSVFA